MNITKTSNLSDLALERNTFNLFCYSLHFIQAYLHIILIAEAHLLKRM